MGAAEGDLEVDLLSEGLERLRGLGPASPNSGQGKVVRLLAGDPAGDGLPPPNKSLSRSISCACGNAANTEPPRLSLSGDSGAGHFPFFTAACDALRAALT